MFAGVLSELKPATPERLAATVSKFEAEVADFSGTLGLPAHGISPLSGAQSIDPACTVVARAVRGIEDVTSWYRQYCATNLQSGAV